MLEHIAKYWMTYACGLLAGGLGLLWKWAQGKFRRLSAMEQASKALLHDRLYRECRTFIARGQVDVEDLENTECLYTAYHALGGNVTGTELYRRVRRLPIAQPAPAGKED